MNTRVNIYIFTQICHHIYCRPDLVQQSRFIGEVNSRNDNHSGREREKKKSFEECEFKKRNQLATQNNTDCTGTGPPLAGLGTAGGDSSVLQSVCYIAFLHDAT